MFKIMLENNVWYYAWADALKDSPCKEEKVEVFVFKLEKVVETKVAYFYFPFPKNSKGSDHDSNRLPSGSCLTSKKK